MFGLRKKKKVPRKSGEASSSPVTPHEPDFPHLEGVPYIDFLATYHQERQPRGYLEIGTQTGKSLAAANCASIAIDPDFQLKHDVIGKKPDLFMYQGTSDDFFASGHLDGRTGFHLDFAFLDGMHLCEYLLRDFINAERHSSGPGACIAMHDCAPYARVMARRSWDKAETRSWTGDVWKLLPILRTYRPDLEIDVLDCPPTSLVLVRNLDPGSRVLSDALEEVIAEYVPISLEDYGVARFVDELALVDSKSYFEKTVA